MPKKLKMIKKSSKKQSKITKNRSKIGPGGLLGGLLGHLGPKSQHSSENPGSRAASWASSWRVKSIKIGPRWSPTSIDFSTYFWDRFSSILESSWAPRWSQNRWKIDVGRVWFFVWFFNGFQVRFRFVFHRFSSLCWRSESAKSVIRIKVLVHFQEFGWSHLEMQLGLILTRF